MKNKTAFLPIRVSGSIAAFLMSNPFWQSYISAACTDRQSSICLASQYTRRSVLRTGWWHAPMLLSNGSLGCCPPQACHRDSKGPCPLPGLMKNLEVDMTKIKSLLQKRQTSLCPGHEWLAIVVLYDFIETCSFLQRPLPLLNKETVQEMVRTARRIGLINSPQVFICEKNFFFVP